MAIEFLERSEVIEECYEFLLAYAGQGLASDEGSQSGGQVREFLGRAAQAIRIRRNSDTLSKPRNSRTGPGMSRRVGSRMTSGSTSR